MTAPLLDVSGLSIERSKGPLRLVEDVSFTLEEGEVMGLVGESGSGKSLTCRAIMRLLPPNIGISAGRIMIDGQDCVAMKEPELRRVRGRKVGMIFQNPASYLNPVMRVGDQIGESLRVHKDLSRKDASTESVEILRQVGIPDPATRIHSYPHEFSGGMKQRALIAAALACRPRILIADEPTTALDVTIQAQILRLLLDLKDRLGLSIILVTHDLSVVAQTCDKTVVMYAGQVMESGPNEAISNEPLHPYSKGLIGSQPELVGPGQELPSIPGQPPSIATLPPGCRFEPRCSMARAACREDVPGLVEVSSCRQSACLFWNELEAGHEQLA